MIEKMLTSCNLYLKSLLLSTGQMLVVDVLGQTQVVVQLISVGNDLTRPQTLDLLAVSKEGKSLMSDSNKELVHKVQKLFLIQLFF